MFGLKCSENVSLNIMDRKGVRIMTFYNIKTWGGGEGHNYFGSFKHHSSFKGKVMECWVLGRDGEVIKRGGGHGRVKTSWV